MNNLDFADLEKSTADFVSKLYFSPDLPHYPYHNHTHTLGVVTHVRELTVHYRLSEMDSFVLAVAAWFHDIGH